MTDAGFDELATVLEQEDEDLKAALPEALDGATEALPTLLQEHPDTFERLSIRLCTLDGIADYADEEPETVDRFLAVLWGGLGFISENVSEVQSEVTEAFSVAWDATDSDVAFHVTSDPDPGTVSGGPGLVEDPTLTFEGETDVLFSMLNDPEFDPVQAFMNDEFELDGPVNRAMTFAQMMEAVTTNVENLNEDS
jgi:hypothetical protein